MRIETENLATGVRFIGEAKKLKKHIRKSNDLWIPDLGETDGDVE